QCLAEDSSAAVLQFFAALRGKLADRMRDLGFCRQRLRGLQDLLQAPADTSEPDADNVTDTMTFTRTPGVPTFGPGAAAWGAQASPALAQTPLLSAEAYWETIRASATNRVVLPDGEHDLEKAAREFLGTLTPEH